MITVINRARLLSTIKEIVKHSGSTVGHGHCYNSAEASQDRTRAIRV